MSDRLLSTLGRIVRDVLRAGLREAERQTTASRRSGTRASSRRSGTTSATTHATGTASGAAAPSASGTYPGDYLGMPAVEYSPVRGDRPDPGEIVWTWVPYEEDHSQGKDRPVLLVGRDGAWLLGLQLTSQDHDRDAAQEARAGRYWVEIGAGAWDSRGRVSEVRVNRVIRVDPDAVRRVSVSLPQETFNQVVAGMREHLA